jgi:Rps23 Pro-64 3,4-dihydroxylase Tpa1-like proline 4-hydroxylase
MAGVDTTSTDTSTPVADSSSFTFDPMGLAAMADDLGPIYRQAEPFPHIVIDDFLPAQVMADVQAAFPRPDDLEWQQFSTRQEQKLASDDVERMTPVIRHLLQEFNSASMVNFLERLTGIDGLVPDPHYWGGGLHQIERGGHLAVHADFNRHERLRLDRRLNLLLYLNQDWQPEWGGALELWSRDMTRCCTSILPVANRCVVFDTTDTSFHGHPEPLACPPDRTRRSLALYYYSNGRPAGDVGTTRTTKFQPRPEEAWKRPPFDARRTARRLLPPVVLDAARNVRDRGAHRRT